MTHDSGFEILSKSITTRNPMAPGPTIVVLISAMVCCPDQSRIQVKIAAFNKVFNMDEIDIKILNVAQKIYLSKIIATQSLRPELGGRKSGRPDEFELVKC